MTESSDKKLGRPSKQELQERERNRIKEENELKDKLLSSGSTLEYPIFKYGDVVKRDARVIITDYNPLGGVIRQDIGSRYVFVYWYDGTKTWIDSRCLVATEDPKKKKKEKHGTGRPKKSKQ